MLAIPNHHHHHVTSPRSRSRHPLVHREATDIADSGQWGNGLPNGLPNGTSHSTSHRKSFAVLNTLPVRKVDPENQQRSEAEESAGEEPEFTELVPKVDNAKDGPQIVELVQKLDKRVRELEAERTQHMETLPSPPGTADSIELARKRLCDSRSHAHQSNGYGRGVNVKGKSREQASEAAFSCPPLIEAGPQPKPFMPFASGGPTFLQKRVASNQIHLYQRPRFPRFLRRPTYYLAVRQGLPLHAIRHRR